VSYWAVITIEADHRKMVVGSPRIAPVVAVLDPLMTYTLPVDLTAYTGLDALTHAIEAFTSTMSNPISDALAITAVEKIGRSFLKAIESPENEGARSDMLLASTMAALAFNSADLGAVHCLSEALGGMMDVHHGLANAIFLAPVMEFNSPAVAGKYDCLARALGPRDAVSAVRNMVEPLCLPSLRELGVREEDLPRLAKMASQNISVPSNPRQVTEEDFSRLLRQVF
jgi:alcohol dehydrogenase